MTYFMERNLFTMKNKKRVDVYKAIDLFAGIGGIRSGFERIFKDKIEFIFASEIDKYACETYYANYGEMPYGDITKIDEKQIPSFDILLGGFPCQAFSIAGKRKGFEDTRGTLFFEIARILKHHKPKIVFLENVKGFKNHDKGTTFQVVKETLENLGYKVFTQILNAKDFGVPQNRERIYIIGFLDHSVEFEFPQKTEKKTKLSKILEQEVDAKYTISDRLWMGHQKRKIEHRKKGNGFGYSLFDGDAEYTSTISARYYKDGSEILIAQENQNPRKLTPREAARLQGFTDDFQIVVSDVQAYKQFGNSVAVPVIEVLAKEINKQMQTRS
ncbi:MULTISPECIES: DNA cytosine methyltransferase [unclassified Sulfurospirillum]|uniref:DNA cytosine methyltransferase n=1 Tax=unclassified Sulfurospirillum TaxID=2618290 RepID=UPI0004FFCA56|nr:MULTISPECIES: DNA cytosine methyltransferase [unclassified Sulfurospirillum]KFL33581.1 hypothetical protein JU57_10380 [Sulfurospirillum sp. SCADC]